MTASQNTFHIDRIRLFSGDGQVYRAFGHLVAARMGALLLVPFHLVAGCCDGVADGCPVPWEEVDAVLEYPAVHRFTDPARWGGVSEHAVQLARLGLDLDECDMDYISSMVNGRETVLRLVHPCGVRYAVIGT